MTQVAGRTPLAAVYFLYFGAVGVVQPYFPAYFTWLGLTPTQIGVLLAVGPVALLFGPTLWAWLAEHFGRTDVVLRVLTFGTLVCFVPIVRARSFEALLLAFPLYALFVTSVTTMLDALALDRVAARGGAYAHLRLFGSVGFMVFTAAFGLWVDEVDRRTAWAAGALVLAFSVASLFVRASSARPPRPRHPLAGLSLLRRPEVRLLLVSTALHWIASAPLHGTLSIHVGALALSPWVVGTASAVGVLAEVGVMAAAPLLQRRTGVAGLLLIAYGGSALRWLGMAVASSAEAIIALSLLHGLSFGAFYVSSVALLAASVPAERRASGQALYVTMTYGVGGLVGYLGAGRGYDLLGGHRLFAVAAALEGVALLVLGLRALAGRKEAAAQ